MENKKTKDKSNNPSIWFSWIIATIIVVVISIKILISDFDFSHLEFGFTDLLSIIIALFAVWISINFYHKNNETSNKFYNNTYTFTKDISETLGRIEERFGEKLESLKEENKSLSNRVEKYYSHSKPKDIEKDEKKEKEIQEKLKLEIEEKDKLLNKFAKRYKIAEQDKNQFIETLNKKNEEVNRLEKKLRLFEQKPVRLDEAFNIPTRIVSYMKRRFRDHKELRQVFCIPDLVGEEGIKEYFSEFSGRFNPSFINDMEKYDLITEDRVLTDSGLKILMEIAHKIDKLST